MDLIQIYKEFSGERECHDYLAKIRWPEGRSCVYCESKRIYKRATGNGMKCRDCNKSFTATTGTIFHSTKLPLSKWFIAIAQILAAKKGISSLQLSRTINVDKNTAWFMQARIRRAMKTDIILRGIVEVDETYVGGALGNMSKKKKQKRNPHKNGMSHKSPVLGMMEKFSGSIVLRAIPHANGENIKPILKKSISPETELVTDGFGGYSGLDKHFKKHIVLNHQKREHKNDDYHMNSIEGFFTTIKRAIIGQYHHVSNKYLQSYMDEIAFKRNNSSSNSFNLLLNRACALS